MGRTIAYAIFGFMIAGAIGYMIYDNIRYAGTSSWQSVSGRIVENEVYSVGGGRGGDTDYSVRVAYSYSVGGREFTGDEIWLTAGTSFETSDDAAAFLGPYRVGNRVTVHYDPANPEDTALIVERGGDPMVILILAGIWGLIGTRHYPRAGDSAEAGPRRAGWKTVLGQMAAAFVVVSVAFVIYVLALGPGLATPPA